MNENITSTQLHYVEAFDHLELINRWRKVWLTIPGLCVTCHVSNQNLISCLKWQDEGGRLHFSGPEEGEKWSEYLSRIDFPSTSIIVLGTITRKPEWFRSIIHHPKYFIVLHNLQYCFSSPFKIKSFFSLRAYMRFARDLYFYSIKKKLIMCAKGYILPTQFLAHWASKKIKEEKTMVLPFATTNERNKPILSVSDKSIKIVVPGKVNCRTRDYDELVNGLRILQQNNVPVNIYFAGKLSDSNVIKKMQRVSQVKTDGIAYETKQSSIITYFFTEDLSNQHFNDLILSADYLLAPLRKYTWFGNYREQTGITKISGIYFDAVWAAKPILMPEWCSLYFSEAIGFSNAQHLASILMQVDKNMPLDIKYPKRPLVNVKKNWNDIITFK